MMVQQSPFTSHFDETVKLLGSDNLKDDNADIQEFQNRVKTFITGQKWVGKPFALSPPRCARFGWKCCSPNKLQCVSCSAVLCTSLPEMRKSSIYDKCLAEVVKSLKTAHRKNCPWPLAPCPEKFFRIVPISKEAAFGDFVCRLESLLPIESYLPEVKGTVAEALALSDSHLKAIGDLSHIHDSPFLKSLILLAATGWKRVPNEGNKKYVTCVHCQRKVGIWFYSSVKPREECTPKEEAVSSELLLPEDVTSHVAQASNSSSPNNTKLGNVCGDKDAHTVASVPENSEEIVICKQEVIDAPESESPNHLNRKRPNSEDNSCTSEQAAPAKKRKLCLETDKPFDPLYEHRPWCMWISETDNPNDARSSEQNGVLSSQNSATVPGYKVYIECLLRNIGNSSSSPCSLPSPTRDQLNKAKELLTAWSSLI